VLLVISVSPSAGRKEKRLCYTKAKGRDTKNSVKLFGTFQISTVKNGDLTGNVFSLAETIACFFYSETRLKPAMVPGSKN
jgi:hypothetical protein